MHPPRRKNRLIAIATFLSAMVVSALTVHLLGQQGGFFYLAIGVPGLHGVLNARSALRYHRQTQSSKLILVIELICASLLILSVAVACTSQSFISIYASWIIAAIATFPLTITSAVEVIQAIRRKRHQRRNTVKFLLNCLALLIYCVLLVGFFFLAVIALSGEPYMGN
jgi:cation transport ATPase